MKKSDLKDGYLLSLFSGEKFYICGAYGLHNSIEDPLYLSHYTDDLKYNGRCYPEGCLNVLSISYMGVILWEADEGTG